MKTNLLTKNLLAELLQETSEPCISIYMPTHRHHPDNQQDPIRFRGLIKGIASELKNNHDADQVEVLMEPLEALANDHGFWNHALDALALFRAPGLFKVITLQRPVQELAIVADSFHTKPLRRFLQSTGRYQILCLSMSGIKLFEGNRDALDEVELSPDVPGTLVEALGEELTEPYLTAASYGGSGRSTNIMYHGHGGKNDGADIDQDRFFRAVDRAILQHHSRPSGLPLMLAALPEYHGVFHKISNNPFVVAEGLKINPDVLSTGELQTRAWEIFEPSYKARLAERAEGFEAAKSKGLGLENVAEIAAAAFSGRVATLMIEADREIAGRIHSGSGKVLLEDSDELQGDDLLDDLAEMVLKQGGEVLVVPTEIMPTMSGAAATCR